MRLVKHRKCPIDMRSCLLPQFLFEDILLNCEHVLRTKFAMKIARAQIIVIVCCSRRCCLALCGAVDRFCNGGASSRQFAG
jgi:hypothetical protein